MFWLLPLLVFQCRCPFRGTIQCRPRYMTCQPDTWSLHSVRASLSRYSLYSVCSVFHTSVLNHWRWYLCVPDFWLQDAHCTSLKPSFYHYLQEICTFKHVINASLKNVSSRPLVTLNNEKKHHIQQFSLNDRIHSASSSNDNEASNKD